MAPKLCIGIPYCLKPVDCTGFRHEFSTYGGFGSSAHALINKMTAEAHPYDFDPWARPGPKSHAYLQLGFALARANARMLINADASRRSAHNRVRTSRLRSPT